MPDHIYKEKYQFVFHLDVYLPLKSQNNPQVSSEGITNQQIRNAIGSKY